MTDLDLADPGFYQDPYRVYAQLRQRGPLFRSAHGPWVATGFAQVTALIKDPRVSVAFPGDARWRARRGPAAVAGGGRWMLLTDGTEHRRLRRPAGRGLGPRAVTGLADRVVSITRARLEELPRSGRLDFVSQVAEPVAAGVIAHVLGLPDGHQADLIRWSSAIIAMADPLTPAPMRAATDSAITECSAFIKAAWRSGALRPDGLAAQLLQGPGALEAANAVANGVLLAVAGIDTTAGQLSSAVLSLLDEPEQLALVRADPAAVAAGAAEFVRFRSPVQIVTRRIADDLHTPSGTLRPGDKLMLVLGAANRDPARYPCGADQLRLTRPDAAPLGFGDGPHYCVGAHLAALVLGSVIGQFVHRHSDLRLAGPAPLWRTSVVAHRPQQLWMETIRP